MQHFGKGNYIGVQHICANYWILVVCKGRIINVTPSKKKISVQYPRFWGFERHTVVIFSGEVARNKREIEGIGVLFSLRLSERKIVPWMSVGPDAENTARNMPA